MAALYSSLLFGSPAAAGGTYNSDPVPVGKVWVVRDIDAILLAAPNLVPNGFTLTDSGDQHIAAQLDGFARSFADFHKETRQVLVAGDFLVMTTTDFGWSWRISGFVLTAP